MLVVDERLRAELHQRHLQKHVGVFGDGEADSVGAKREARGRHLLRDIETAKRSESVD